MYADIVVPLALPTLTFSIDEQMSTRLTPGCSVVVEVGARKLYQGIVWRIHDNRPNFRTIKSVLRITSCDPLLKPQQMELWEWISTYYMCTLGEVMRAALPSALKPEGFTHDEFDRDQFKHRTKQIVSLHAAIDSTQSLNDAFESLRRSRKQIATLTEIIEKLGLAETDELSEKPTQVRQVIDRKELDTDIATLRALEKKQIISVDTVIDDECRTSTVFSNIPVLTEAQCVSYDAVRQAFSELDVALLHGITGSGKTEIYINLIAEKLAAGDDVLYLLPEIALTSQLIERLERCFGDRVVAYHSKFSDRRRAEVYHRVGHEGGNLVVGVRSSVFLPFTKLGLVVVDEEHETSFKQVDPAPRYHARDCAIVLASLHGAKTLLGSATPSVESYANATGGKYGLVTLSERYGDAELPTILISDTRRAAKRGERTVHFNKLLLDKMEQAISDGYQVMLFQNRRGFSPYVECGQCGWVAQCPHCNVSLTLHKGEGHLRCHYCGFKMSPPAKCPSCNQIDIQTKGFGTEKIEEELARIFPQANIARLDADTARTHSSYRKIISDFEHGATNILIGTQMITKGFDFDGVSLVGILNADNLLNYPDFRATERAFQLMTQVAGRAGRRERRGEVVIQTSQPEHPLLRQIVEGDYLSMMRGEMVVRQSFVYPPYCRIVLLTLKHRDRLLVWGAAMELDQMARKVFGRRVLGPEAPGVDRIKGEYLVAFIIKIERERSFAHAKQLLRDMIDTVNTDKRFRYVSIVCDVDPQ